MTCYIKHDGLPAPSCLIDKDTNKEPDNITIRVNKRALMDGAQGDKPAVSEGAYG